MPSLITKDNVGVMSNLMSRTAERAEALDAGEGAGEAGEDCDERGQGRDGDRHRCTAHGRRQSRRRRLAQIREAP